jgi:hypothetical protein
VWRVFDIAAGALATIPFDCSRYGNARRHYECDTDYTTVEHPYNHAPASCANTCAVAGSRAAAASTKRDTDGLSNVARI